jgi:hypothetical protein
MLMLPHHTHLETTHSADVSTKHSHVPTSFIPFRQRTPIALKVASVTFQIANHVVFAGQFVVVGEMVDHLMVI